MTLQEREEMLALRQMEQKARQSLEEIHLRLRALEEAIPLPVRPLPPIPPLPVTLVPITGTILPAIDEEAPPLPALPPQPVLSRSTVPEEPTRPPFPSAPLPPIPSATAARPLPPVPTESFETRLGRWLPRLGVVFFILFLVSFGSYAYFQLSAYLGPWIKLAILALLAGLAVGIGLWVERKGQAQLVFGRTLAAGGLAGLYYVLYAASAVPGLQIIHSPLLAGMLLLAWSAGVFYLAEQKKSELLSLFAVTLAYFSSGLNPLGNFTLAANLLLALTAVVFLLRNSWAALGYASLLGTYLTPLLRLFHEQVGWIFGTGTERHFASETGYLSGAWLIFTAAVFLSRNISFQGGRRSAFLTLNNLAFTVLLATHLESSGFCHLGAFLLGNGALYLALSLLARFLRQDALELAGAYLAQGLIVITAGLMIGYAGVTRGLLLGLESVFIEMAGAFSRSRILRAAAYLSSLLAFGFVFAEIVTTDHHVWLLSLGGAAAMLLNAWMSRWDVPLTAEGRAKLVLSSSYYIILALGLIYFGCETELSVSLLPPVLALVALALTFSIYLVPLYELPPLAQLLLVIAQAYAIFPEEAGEPVHWWTPGIVAAVTLLLSAWWPRETATRRGAWLTWLNFYYALAMVGLTYHAVRPLVDLQGWVMVSGLLSVAFVIYGYAIRSWPFALVGQSFLFLSAVASVAGDTAAIAGWAALAPIILIYATARGAHTWLKHHPQERGNYRRVWYGLAYGYQIAALLLTLAWVSVYLPVQDRSAADLTLGSIILLAGAYRSSRFGITLSYLATLAGFFLYAIPLVTPRTLTYLLVEGLGLLFFLLQPLILESLRKRKLVTSWEIWIILLLAVVGSWDFLSGWTMQKFGTHYLTIGWALYALLLVLLGLISRERRYRLIGLILLLLSIVRVLVIDIWTFSSLERMLTFLVLTIVTLGLGYLYARYADRFKDWL